MNSNRQVDNELLKNYVGNDVNDSDDEFEDDIDRKLDSVMKITNDKK